MLFLKIEGMVFLQIVNYFGFWKAKPQEREEQDGFRVAKDEHGWFLNQDKLPDPEDILQAVNNSAARGKYRMASDSSFR
jgi:hypothetical protein